MADLDQTDFDKLDRDALQRSLELALAETDDPDMVANLRDKAGGKQRASPATAGNTRT